MDLRRRTKSALGWALCTSGLHRAAFRDRAIVLCFHSVSDGPPSPIACTTAEFRAYLEFFARFFEVISLDALLDRLETGADISRALVITFDDGYADNAETAAPELKRLGLPATFFVATDFIGSDHQAWWDTDVGVRSRWMTWDQVRALHADGFQIGAHTRSHADLGALPYEAACAEIGGSVERIEAELGRRPTLFAFPFGGPANITDPVREFVRESGLRCCPSAFGGLVSPEADPYALNRLPIIAWYRSPQQLALEAARLRSGEFSPHAARSRPG